jgi:hypothetical protein
MSEREAFLVRARAEQTSDLVELTLTVELPHGVHIEPHEPPEPYLIPTVLEVPDLLDVDVAYPAPVVKPLGWNDLTLTVLEGTLIFVVRGRVPAGVQQIRGRLRYQPCVGGACLPPRSVPWESPIVGETSYSILRASAA